MTERPSEGAERPEGSADRTFSSALFARWVEDRTAGDPAAFERLVGRHPERADELRAMRADWEVLEGLRSSRSVAERLSARPGSEPGPALPADARAGHALSPDLLARLSERAPASGRYRLKGEVARGGQGAIVHVWDEDLRRNLAMKVIHARVDAKTSNEESSRALGRFLEEAQITGQLSHPGIVPVHELGLDAEGRVYFTMRLVKGRDLKEILDLLGEGKEGWNLPRALSVLLKVCLPMILVVM